MQDRNGYTQSVIDEYCSYAAQSESRARAQLENMPESASIHDWIRKFQEIKNEYTCTPRYILMKSLEDNDSLVCERWEGKSAGYAVKFHGKRFEFRHVTRESSYTISDEESKNYIILLSQIAADHEQDEAKAWRPLFKKAFLRYNNITLLSREEGLQICHGLGFSYQEAEHFLVRTLENDGFLFHRSDDLIQSFCFLHRPANSWHMVQSLRASYDAIKNTTPKAYMAEKDNFTSVMIQSLPANITLWEASSADVRESFLKWMKLQSPFLDLHGKTAYEIYRRLVALICSICKQEIDYFLLDEDDVIDRLDAERSYEENSILLNYSDNYDSFSDYISEYCLEGNDLIISPYEAANILTNYLKYMFTRPDSRTRLYATSHAKTMRYLMVDANNNLANESISTRIPALLNDEVAVTKGDMLFMLYFACNLFWDTDDSREDHFYDFLDLAEDILDKSLLPAFYIPHILERTLFLSILVNPEEIDEFVDDDGQTDIGKPFEVYGLFCEEFVKRRVSAKAKKAKSDPAENDETAATTKQKRKVLIKEIEKQFKKGLIDFYELDCLLIDHVKTHANKEGLGEYSFEEDGVYYSMADKDIRADKADAFEKICDYSPLLEACKEDYYFGNLLKEPAANLEIIRLNRFRLLYGLKLQLEKLAQMPDLINFRVNYKSNCVLSFTRHK